jgi:ATP-dependent DNA ligase
MLAQECRRAQLESIVAEVVGLAFSEAIEGNGTIVFAHACKLGLEGIASKRMGSLYSWAAAGGAFGRR